VKPQIFNLIIGILGSIIVILPFTGKIYDARNKWFKRLKLRGWLIIIVFISTIYVTYEKDLKSERDIELASKKVEIEKRKDDSDVRVREKKSKLEVINALAKYNLALDSNQKTIIKLVRDSAKRIVNVKSEIQPVLDISDIFLDSVSYPIYFIKIRLRCRHATSYKVFIKFYVLSETQDGYHFFTANTAYLAKGIDLAEGLSYTTPPIEFREINKTVKRFHILFTGVYENLDGKKIPFRQLLNYDIPEKRMGFMLEPFRSKILETYKEYGITQ
jgi:hypothetical protein